MDNPVNVHLIYIHGFQGNDTTFQVFPTHLQEYLSSHIPSHLNVKFISSLYPTYKSVKPISHATKNFLEWLSTQPPGPVILLGHSMGGLLAAEAATHPSNNPHHHPGAKPNRIMGMIAFDCPYLGMHPHVVISGIASLFADEDDKTSEAQMNNQEKVNVVDEKVTDDWESFKRRLNAVSSISLDSKNESSLTLSSVSSNGSSPRSPSPSKFLDRAINFVAARADEPIARWVRKHRDEPVKAGKRWIIERFQFGICMFDPAGLRSRYAKLVGWQGGLWVNYWTQTTSKSKASPERKEAEAIDDNDEALLETGVVDPGTAKDLGVTETKDKQRADSPKKEKKLKPGRHFIVLPTGLGAILGGGENWERVLIEGVGDEVEAHCGLFIPGQNLNYQGLVERTSDRVLKWCETIQKRTE